jgi:ketosteroid isomerase-like protein
MSYDPMSGDDAFFGALERGDGHALDRILARDFTIIDVFRGAVTERDAFLGAVSSGQLTFDEIEAADRQVRYYDGVALISGRTRLRGSLTGRSFASSSRYTHVFVEDGDRTWRLVSAQGTPIVP